MSARVLKNVRDIKRLTWSVEGGAFDGPEQGSEPSLLPCAVKSPPVGGDEWLHTEEILQARALFPPVS
jgi:hypothetical protein